MKNKIQRCPFDRTVLSRLSLAPFGIGLLLWSATKSLCAVNCPLLLRGPRTSARKTGTGSLVGNRR